MIEEEAVKKKPFLYCFSAEKFQEISGLRRKSGEKPHYMVEAPRRDGICGGWSSGKRFGIIDRQKIHPPGFLGKVYKGGIVMKGKKKLLSVLLAAALVGQMGVVVGVSNTGDTAPACNQSDHGMNGHKVTSVNGCESGMHWLGGTGALQGGTGRNYFYPTASNTTINCTGTKNVIILKNSFLEEITILEFGEDDVLYIPTDIIVDTSEETESVRIIKQGTDGIEIGTISLKPGVTNVTTGELPRGLGAKLSDQLVVTDITNAVGELTYLWQYNSGNGGTDFTDIPNVDTGKNSIDAETENGKWIYRCIVVDEAGQVVTTNKVTKEVGCAYTPNFVTDIKATTTNADNTKIEWTTGTPFNLEANDEAAYTFVLSNPAEYTGDYCDKTDGNDHGYKPVWGIRENPVAGVTLTNGQLVVNAKEVETGTHDVKLAVSIGKTDAEGFKAGYVKNDIVFRLEKAAPSVTPPEPTEPEPPESSEPENPGGETTDKTEGEDKNPPPSTGENPGETTDPEKPDVDTKPENPGSNQPDTKPEEPTISVEGDTDGNSGSAPNKINLDKDSENFSFQYKVNVSGGTEGQYQFTWTLKTKTGEEKPDYIKVTHNGSNLATVDIDKDKLPSEGVEETFILTATAKPKAVAKMSKVRVANTVDPKNGELTANYEITVKAAPNTNQGAGDTAPAACTRTIKQVTITPKDTALIHFEENATNKIIEWKYDFTWNNDCSALNCNHEETVDLIWKIKTTGSTEWAIQEGAVNTAQKTGNIKIISKGIPKTAGNKISFEAYTKKADGTEDKQVTTVGEITITRDPMCTVPINKISITGTDEGPANIGVVKGKKAYGQYKPSITYGEGGICDKEDHIETEKDHKPNVEWEISNVTLGDKECDDNTKNAFTIDENGKLTINGSKLIAGKTYSVKIRATAGGQYDVRTVTVTCTAPTSSGSSSSDDTTDDTDWYQWQDFEDDISDAKRGSTVKVNLRDNTDMPFYIFDEVRGRDVNLQMKVSGGYTWTVNGKTVKKLPENQVWVALGVDSYKNSRMSTLCRSYDVKSFQLENKGSFYGDMKLTMNVGSSYAKKTMFLYSYDEDKNKLTYCSSSKADDTGDVSFVFARSLGAYVVTSKALYGESAVGSGGGTVGGTGSGNSPTTVYPPVASVPASKPPASSSSSSSSSSQSSSSSEPAPPPAEPSSTPDTTPTDTKTEPEQKAKIPVLVPVLILSIAGVITATVLVVRSGRGKEDF